MKLIPVLALFLLARPALAAEPVKISDIEQKNVRVRLVAVKMGQERLRSFVAKFETLGTTPEEILISTDYRNFTTHDYTIRELITSCVDETADAEWKPALPGVIAILSVPKEGVKRGQSLENCFLMSLNFAKPKK